MMSQQPNLADRGLDRIQTPVGGVGLCLLIFCLPI
jgi:hypothetical protein